MAEILVVRLADDRFDDAVATLCSAFRDYPVMRFVIGEAGDDYDRRLTMLIGMFNAHRFARGYPILGALQGGEILGVASLNPPVAQPLPPEIERQQEATWEELGSAARDRMQAFIAATGPFDPEEPHYHLGMLGVLRSAAGKGVGRLLLDAVHALSAGDPGSRGVSLSTEDPRNVSLYEHFGYTIVGEDDVGAMHTWVFYRPDAQDPKRVE